MFKPWEQLSRNEQLHSEYYDFYKEVHGIRPRWIYAEGGVPAHSEAEMEQMLEALAQTADVVFAEEQQAEQANITKFEATVAKLCSEMNKSRETIVRWMFEGSDVNGDWDYYCWQLGVPYGYFAEFYAKAA